MDIVIGLRHKNLGQGVVHLDRNLERFFEDWIVKVELVWTYLNLDSNLRGKLVLEFGGAYSTLILLYKKFGTTWKSCLISKYSMWLKHSKVRV